jgi:hypothetical protein
MGLLDSEWNKEVKKFDAVGFKNQRRNLRVQKKRTGKSDLERDKSRHALLAGKRISKNGNIYFEGRVNRSDSKGSNV